MHRKPVAALILVLLLPVAALANDPVVNAMRQSDKEGSSNAKPQACELLEKASAGRGQVDARNLKIIADQIASKMREGDASMYWARGDAARLGLYGFKKNPQKAFSMYVQGAKAGSEGAGYNAALMLYKQASFNPDQATAQKILDLLQKSKASDYNVKGDVSSKSHYIVGRLYETGQAGRKDVGRAFLHYRVSARNEYAPGVYHYLRLLLGSLPHLSDQERRESLQEMRVMANRWKWSSPDIMRLVGDIYAAGWFKDKDGFMAQYHWRIAARMLLAQGGGKDVMSDRIRRLDTRLEKQLSDAVEAALRINSFNQAAYVLDFANLCPEASLE